jgi:hypothetical protein
MTDIIATEPTTREEYDVIVIGAGAVGENVADRTVQGARRSPSRGQLRPSPARWMSLRP